MEFKLPELPYALNALNPYIGEKTMEFHYGKHHKAYVDNLNNLVKGTKYENASLEQIIRDAEGGIYNNGAQVWNHTFYFSGFSKEGNRQPLGIMADAINRSFGSFDQFKEKFTNAAASLFGSGWAWLVKNNDGSLEIIQESNAGNPLRSGLTPVLTCDVWEHAYYLDYQNRRIEYIKSFWNILNWDQISKRYQDL
jgi:Fe-Mn family superoxide dismutase